MSVCLCLCEGDAGRRRGYIGEGNFVPVPFSAST